MTFDFPITITRVRGGGFDQHGAPTPEERVELEGFAFAPGVSTETNTFRDQVDSKGELYGPYDVDLRPTDSVELPPPFPLRWVVDGEPAHWGPNPHTGSTPGSVTTLKRQEG